MSFLIYLTPYLTNISISILTTLFLMNANRMNFSPIMISLIPVLFGIVAFVSCLIGIKIKFQKNTYYKMMYLATLLLILLSIVSSFYLSPTSIYIYSSIKGISMAAFFMSFQVLLDDISSQFPVNISSGLYALSWTTGLASGPFITGMIFELNQTIAHIIVISIEIIIAVLLTVSIRMKKNLTVKIYDGPKLYVTRYKVWIGRVLFLAMALIIHTLRYMFVDYAIGIGFTPFQVGLIVAIPLASLGFSSLFFAFAFKYLERPITFIILTFLITISLLTLSLSKSFVLISVSMALIGFVLSSGCVFAVSYAIGDAKNAGKNVAIVESIGSSAYIVGPLIMGFIAQHFEYFYGFIALAIFGLLCYVCASILMCLKTKIEGDNI